MDSEIADNANNISNAKKEKPSGTPPAKPGEKSNTSTTGEENSSSSDESTNAPEQMDGEMPEMPECEEGDEDCEMPAPPGGMQGGSGGEGFPGEMTMDANSGNTWHPAAYLAMGAGSIVLAVVIAYSCFSNFYRKKPTQVFDKWQKIAIFCTLTVVLAVGIGVLCYFIPEWVNS